MWIRVHFALSGQSRALVLISFRRLFFGELASFALPDIAAVFAYSSRPMLSASARTLVLTVAPSRRFLLPRTFSIQLHVETKSRHEKGIVGNVAPTHPSLLDCAIASANFQSFPSRMINPLSLSRAGVQPGSSLTMVGIFELRLLDKTMILSSSKSWKAFFRVSLLTASK